MALTQARAAADVLEAERQQAGGAVAAEGQNGAPAFDFKQYMGQRAELVNQALDASVPMQYPELVNESMRCTPATPHEDRPTACTRLARADSLKEVLRLPRQQDCGLSHSVVPQSVYRQLRCLERVGLFTSQTLWCCAGTRCWRVASGCGRRCAWRQRSWWAAASSRPCRQHAQWR
jgi:hypothetical protein